VHHRGGASSIVRCVVVGWKEVEKASSRGECRDRKKSTQDSGRAGGRPYRGGRAQPSAVVPLRSAVWDRSRHTKASHNTVDAQDNWQLLRESGGARHPAADREHLKLA
jgi:hypothetical protein